MGTTSDKLTYLNTTKGKIKDVINMTGANITSETTFRNYATKLYDGYISVLKDKNTLLENMPKGTSTGAITDAADLPVYEDKMSKESTQETTTGKNKFDKDNVDWYRNNDSRYDNKTNNSSTRIKTSSFEIQGGKTYKISGYPNTVSLLAIRTYNNEQTHLGDVAFPNGVFTLNSDVSYMHLLFGGSNFTDETNELMKNANIQIEEGTTATDYEPYTGGQPSPNPDYPQEVKTVKGYRNLFDKANYTSGKWLGQSGSISNDSNFGYSDYIEIKSSTSYFLSGLANGGDTHPGFCFYDTTYTYISGEENNGRTSILITTPLNAKYIRFSFKKVDLDTIQLVEGTEELPYVPYGTNYVAITNTNGTDTNYYTIPLNDNEIAGKGDYQDEYIIDKNGHCWLNKKIGKVVLDGINNSFASVGSTNTTGVHRFMTADIGSKLSTSSTEIIPAFCNRLISKSLDDTYVKQEGFSFLNSTHRISIYIDEISTYTLEQANEWLLTHNLKLYYPLAQEDLIDLNYTVDLTLFEGVNNISNSDDMDMEIKYIKDTYE